MAKINYDNIALFVKDIKLSKNFYTNVLKQEIDEEMGNGLSFKSGFGLWELGDDDVILNKIGKENIRKIKNPNFLLVFNTDNIEEIIDRLKENNIELLHDVYEESWGQKTIRFYDPDNHLIEIGETMKSVIKRLHKNGMAPKEISKKTYMDIDTIEKYLSE